MSLVLDTNVNSLVAQNALTNSGTQLASSLEQLSTGLRINTAADDPAGYAIVNGMTSQINGLNQAVQNANDGVSLSQTANGALSEITNDLQTIRDLAVQSLNATNSASDRQSLNDQVTQLEADIDSVATTTSFNGVNLLDGSFQGQVFQTGPNVGNSISIGSIASARSANLGQTYTAGVTSGALTAGTTVNLAALTINGTAVGAATIATDAYSLASAINSANFTGVTATAAANTLAGTAYVGAAGLTGSITINGVSTAAVTTTGVAATDLANVTSAINAISAATGITATNNGGNISLSNANSSSSGANIVLAYTGTLTAAGTGVGAAGTKTSTFQVNYAGVAGGQLVIGGTITNSGLTAATTVSALSGKSIANTDVLTVANSNATITSVDAALQQIDATGAQLGAYQARFQAAVVGLQSTSTNLSSARSSIEDTDYAAATSQLTKSQILQQAGTAMVAQANTIPQNVLTLLQHLA
jgi:flagellin